MEAVSFAANSFEGRRKRNEDQIGVLQIEENTWFLGLADGMGGPGNGEIASNMVIETAREVVLDAFNQRRRVPLKRILSKIYLTAYQRIRDEIEMKPYLSGMGSTLVSVLIHDGEMVWGNMGDSRLYLLRSGFVMQLTKDHTKLQQQLDSRSVRRKINTLDGNILTRVICDTKFEPDLFPQIDKSYPLQAGDVLLLCSDGLITDKQDDDPTLMERQLKREGTLEFITEQLISEAFYNESHDNISIVLATYGNRIIQDTNLPVHPYPPIEHNALQTLLHQLRGG